MKKINMLMIVMLVLLANVSAQQPAGSIKGKIATADNKPAEGVTVLVKNTVKMAVATGIIKGTVTTNDGKPAADVTVLLKDHNNSDITNYNGAFKFNKIKTGIYTLQISLIGYETLEQEVSVIENNTAELALQLTLSDKQLQEVIVISNRSQLFAKQTNYVAKMPLKNLENPQVYNSV